jgi:hypothetical protein
MRLKRQRKGREEGKEWQHEWTRAEDTFLTIILSEQVSYCIISESVLHDHIVFRLNTYVVSSSY